MCILLLCVYFATVFAVFVLFSGSGTPFGWSFANLIFFKKVRRGLGLDKCHFPMTGSAPISQDTLAYFMSVNIPIHELYGMSETTGPTTVTTQVYETYIEHIRNKVIL